MALFEVALYVEPEVLEVEKVLVAQPRFRLLRVACWWSGRSWLQELEQQGTLSVQHWRDAAIRDGDGCERMVVVVLVYQVAVERYWEMF